MSAAHESRGHRICKSGLAKPSQRAQKMPPGVLARDKRRQTIGGGGQAGFQRLEATLARGNTGALGEAARLWERYRTADAEAAIDALDLDADGHAAVEISRHDGRVDLLVVLDPRERELMTVSIINFIHERSDEIFLD